MFEQDEWKGVSYHLRSKIGVWVGRWWNVGSNFILFFYLEHEVV